ncbi:mitochondrial carrier domain-containing protein [Boletus edulis BED1]|uniref:Mitochondrial carrier domain-containing protein n=1 Tax=Boletus edulis BED1 TaxID=1328754 RepID=A0AAD4C1T6_BOLED|nr:mitochondrial carrier domain-containing protein [Boletus edulis BED1]
MASNPSLRDLYNPPSTQWSFFPPPSSSVPKQSATNASFPSYQWTNRPAPNSIFDLSSSLSVGEASSLDVSLLFRSLVASALLQYSSTAMAMPLEVGKLLLQIQWVPKDALTQEPEDEAEEEAEILSLATNEEDSYFVEPGTVPTHRPAPKLVDDRGYMIRTSVMEDGTRPEYIISVGSASTSWGMIKRLINFHGEGWLSLWKGLLTSCIHDVAFANLQPLVDSVLHSLFLSSQSGFYRPSPLLPVASHVLTGFLLSPLDLIRTRLIAQSSMPRYKTYGGPIHALSDILANEGGLRGIYLHPHLLIPTVLETGLRTFMHIALPAVIAPRLWLGPHVAADTHPVAWAFAEVLAGCACLLVTLPIETVRRRLQIQTRGTAKPLRACVETRPVPYNGIVDTMWHILTEERSDLPIQRPRRRRTVEKEKRQEEAEVGGGERWLRRTGVGQLYRGLGMRLAASVIVFLLAVVGGGEDVDGGWAEL